MKHRDTLHLSVRAARAWDRGDRLAAYLLWRRTNRNHAAAFERFGIAPLIQSCNERHRRLTRLARLEVCSPRIACSLEWALAAVWRIRSELSTFLDRLLGRDGL